MPRLESRLQVKLRKPRQITCRRRKRSAELVPPHSSLGPYFGFLYMGIIQTPEQLKLLRLHLTLISAMNCPQIGPAFLPTSLSLNCQDIGVCSEIA
jgi:hypothetical protein